MKKTIMLIPLLLFTTVFIVIGQASKIVEFNTTSASSIVNATDTYYISNLRIKEIRQDPFPANPGENVDIYLKIENTGNQVRFPRFQFTLPPQFDLIPSEDTQSNQLSMDYGEMRTLHYTIRISERALPDNYEVGFRAYISDTQYYPYFFNLKVEDVTSNFDVVINEISDRGVSLEISNIAINDAKAVAIFLEEQNDFDIEGYFSYIVGNIKSGDDTSVSVLLLPKSYSLGSILNLKVRIDYTDKLGIRRSIEKFIPVIMTAQTKRNFEKLSMAIKSAQNNNISKRLNFYKTAAIILVLLFIIFNFYYVRKLRHSKR